MAFITILLSYLFKQRKTRLYICFLSFQYKIFHFKSNLPNLESRTLFMNLFRVLTSNLERLFKNQIGFINKWWKIQILKAKNKRLEILLQEIDLSMYSI